MNEFPVFPWMKDSVEDEIVRIIFPALIRTIQEHFRPSLEGKRVLDLGGGRGVWLEEFLKAGISMGLLVDVEFESVEFAHQKWESLYLLKNSGETEKPWRAQSARPRGMSHANSLRVAKGGACPPLLRSCESSSLASIVGNASHIPLQARSVDVVVSRNSLHLWEDIPQAVFEIFRVLRPNGCALLGRGFGPNLSTELYLEIKEKRKSFRALAGTQGDRTLSPPPEQLREWLEAAGFSKITIIPDRKPYWIYGEKPE